MGMLNYSTSIAAAKTVGEMQAMLAAHGAARIAVDYEDGGPTALSFLLVTPHGPRHFTLPVRVDAVQALLVKEDRAGKLKSGSKATRTSHEQAERVGWRVMKDWLAAQLALVDAALVSLDEVMLPYLHVDADGRTLYAAYKDRESVAQIEGGR